MKVTVKKIKNESDVLQILKGLNFNKLFQNEEKVYIKPNFVAPRDNSTGATTNLKIIKTIAEALNTIGVNPIIIETPGMEYNVEDVFNALNIYDFAEQNNIGLCIPKPKDFVKRKIFQGKVLKFAEIPQQILNYKLINIPVMKTHVITTITLGMKNLMGLCSNSTKRMMHVKGIHKTIVDLNKLIIPDLTIIDATNTMQGDGAVYGDHKKLDIVIASQNTIAADKIGSRIMGLEESTISFLNLTNFKKKIQIDGELKCYDFTLPKPGKIYRLIYRLLYFIDIFFFSFFKTHFNKFLYSTGLIGTRPEILKKCTKCGICSDICPVNAILMEKQKIDYKKCIRCLKCLEVCPEKAIIIKGVSKPEKIKKND